MDYPSRIIGPVVLPLSQAIRGGLDQINASFQGFTQSRALVSENQRLRAQMQANSQYNEVIRNLEERINVLRRMNRLQALEARRKVPAEVVAYDVRQHRIQIIFDGSQPVKAGDAVINGDGLVGRIDSISGSRAYVLLATSPAFRMGAMVMSQPPVAGLIRGSTSGRMTLGNAESATHLKPGDQVTTSTFSETIPPYIPIGRIEQRLSQPEFGIEEFRVRLNVQMAHVREVLVVGQ